MFFKWKNVQVANTRINKIYLSYFKPSFDLGIYIIQFFSQYTIII